jgi:hypothetical protein
MQRNEAQRQERIDSRIRLLADQIDGALQD